MCLHMGSFSWYRFPVRLKFQIYPVLTNSLHGLWDPEVQCSIHKGSPIIPILSWINPITRIDTYLFKVHSNIVLPSTPRPPKALFPVEILKELLPSFILSDVKGSVTLKLLVWRKSKQWKTAHPNTFFTFQTQIKYDPRQTNHLTARFLI